MCNNFHTINVLSLKLFLFAEITHRKIALRKYVNLKVVFGRSTKNNGTEIAQKFNSFGFKISHDDTRLENTNKKGYGKCKPCRTQAER